MHTKKRRKVEHPLPNNSAHDLRVCCSGSDVAWILLAKGVGVGARDRVIVAATILADIGSVLAIPGPGVHRTVQALRNVVVRQDKGNEEVLL